MRYGMAVDLQRCAGCQCCTISCKAENGTRPKIFWNRVIDKEVGEWVDDPSVPGLGKRPEFTRIFFSMRCMHCKEPACKAACPVGAISKRADGVVLIDYDTCIGCRRCEWACPYGAPQFNGNSDGYFPDVGLTPYEQATYAGHRVGAVEKCTFCAHRLAIGKLPACVHNCLGRALIFGDLDDPTSEVSQLIATRGGYPLSPEMGTEPSVYYLPRP